MKILITCGAGIYTPSIAEAIKKNNKFEIFFCDSDRIEVDFLKGNGFNIEFVESAESVDQVSYITSINKLVIKWKIDFILPASDMEAIYLKKSFLGDQTISADLATCEICINKFETLNMLKNKVKNKINYFKIDTSADITKLITLSKKKKYCIKPLKGRGARGFYYIKKERNFSKSSSEELAHLITIAELSKIKKEQPYILYGFLCMEYIEGQDYNIDLSTNKGEILDICIQRRDKPLHGPITQGIVEENHKIYKFLQNLVKVNHMSGVLNIELILDNFGLESIPKIYEINPRISAAISFTELFCPSYIERAIFALQGKKIRPREFSKQSFGKIKRIWGNQVLEETKSN